MCLQIHVYVCVLYGFDYVHMHVGDCIIFMCIYPYACVLHVYMLCVCVGAVHMHVYVCDVCVCPVDREDIYKDKADIIKSVGKGRLMECIHSCRLLVSGTNHTGQHLLPGDTVREAVNSRQSSSVELTSVENLPSLLEKINEQFVRVLLGQAEKGDSGHRVC